MGIVGVEVFFFNPSPPTVIYHLYLLKYSGVFVENAPDERDPPI